MRLYLAGWFNSVHVPLEFMNPWEHGMSVLHSFHYWRPKVEEYLSEFKGSIFVDSGGFSARTLGVEVDMDKYGRLLAKHPEWFCVIANLDAPIGQNEQSFKNWRYLQQYNPAVCPVIHLDQDPVWFYKYKDAGADYILVGGSAGSRLTTTQLCARFDRLWANHLTDNDGKPHCKIHGFGITSPELISRYPWHSVDSTSWLFGGRNGDVYSRLNGVAHKIGCGRRRQENFDQHILSLSPLLQERILQSYRASLQSERSLQEILAWVLADYKIRNYLNAIYFASLEKYAPEKFTFKPTGLF